MKKAISTAMISVALCVFAAGCTAGDMTPDSHPSGLATTSASHAAAGAEVADRLASEFDMRVAEMRNEVQALRMRIEAADDATAEMLRAELAPLEQRLSQTQAIASDMRDAANAARSAAEAAGSVASLVDNASSVSPASWATTVSGILGIVMGIAGAGFGAYEKIKRGKVAEGFNEVVEGVERAKLDAVIPPDVWAKVKPYLDLVQSDTTKAMVRDVTSAVKGGD